MEPTASTFFAFLGCSRIKLVPVQRKSLLVPPICHRFLSIFYFCVHRNSDWDTVSRCTGRYKTVTLWRFGANLGTFDIMERAWFVHPLNRVWNEIISYLVKIIYRRFSSEKDEKISVEFGSTYRLLQDFYYVYFHRDGLKLKSLRKCWKYGIER